MTIADNVKCVLDRAGEAAIRSGRTPGDIAVLAASKMNSADRVREAISAGIRILGENRQQELTEKNAQGAYDGTALHFIGHLQKNKLNKLVGVCDMIQSVDSFEIMEAISQRAMKLDTVQDVLVEINIGREENKSGVLPECADELLAKSSDLKGICIKGLMSIPPKSENNARNYNYFDELCKIYVDMSAKKYDNINMCVLSMGMSADFESAILAGATMVRIGSGIFGQRHY